MIPEADFYRAGEAFQNHINVAIEAEGTTNFFAQEMRNAAEQMMVPRYPQYARHWDGYLLGRVKRNIVTKGGECFLNGDWVLYRPNANIISISDYFSVWSFRNMCDVSVHYSDLQRRDLMVVA